MSQRACHSKVTSKYSYFDKFTVTGQSSIYGVKCANARILFKFNRGCISLPVATGARAMSVADVNNVVLVHRLESGRSNQHSLPVDTLQLKLGIRHI